MQALYSQCVCDSDADASAVIVPCRESSPVGQPVIELFMTYTSKYIHRSLDKTTVGVSC